jgi:hypothetical protein
LRALCSHSLYNHGRLRGNKSRHPQNVSYDAEQIFCIAHYLLSVCSTLEANASEGADKGPSKSELKKRAKEAEKAQKAAEKAAKQAELAAQKAAADVVRADTTALNQIIIYSMYSGLCY